MIDCYSVISLTGYEPIIQADSTTNAGEVGVYVSNKFFTTIIEKSDLLLNCENIWFQINNMITDDTFTLGVIYHHPKDNEKNFIFTLNDNLVKLNDMIQKYYIIGDFNIDVKTSNISNNSALFLNALNSNGVYSFIDKPTTVTGSSSTTIDHILTNDTSNIIYPSIFLSEISDHFPVESLVAHYKLNSNNNNQKSKTAKYMCRDESKFNNKQFTSDLCISLRSSLIKQKFDSCIEVDQNFSSFVNIVNKCVNRHAPFEITSHKKM